MNWPKMTPAEIAAFVGAAAWLPQIGLWVYNAFARPALRISSGMTAELGYSSNLGPIANMTLALSTSRKDALIERMTIEARHQDGDVHLFTWVALDEKFSELRNPSGERVEVSKYQVAIAMKVSTLGLTEKKVLFQDLDHQERHRELLGKVWELYDHLATTKQPKAGGAVCNSKELANAFAHFRDSMYWKEGTYVFRVHAYEARSKEPHVEAFDVTVTRAHFDALRRNADVFEQNTRELYRAADEVRDSEERPEAGTKREEPSQLPAEWQWAYPKVVRHKKK